MTEDFGVLGKRCDEWQKLADDRGAVLQTVCVVLSRLAPYKRRMLQDLIVYLDAHGWHLIE